MKEDFDAFFGDFGTPALWSYSNSWLPGIFHRAYVEVEGVESREPIFTAEAAAFSDVAQGQTLTIGTTVYSVVAVEPDGTGLVRLRLRES